MLIRATVKWPGHNGELFIEAKDSLDFANQLRRLNREFKPGEDINFNSGNVVYSYNNTTYGDAKKSTNPLAIIDKKDDKKAVFTRNDLTTDQDSKYYQPYNVGEFYTPKGIKILKRLLIDDIDLSSLHEEFIIRYEAQLAAYNAPGADQQANPAPSVDDQRNYKRLEDEGKVKNYKLKLWREKKGDLGVQNLVSLDNYEINDLSGLEEKIVLNGGAPGEKNVEVRVVSNNLLNSGTAGYEKCWRLYRDYRDNANVDMIPAHIKDEAGKAAWLAKHAGQTVIQVYCDLSEDEFIANFKPFAESHQSSVPDALGSVARRTIFTKNTVFNPFSWITVGALAMGILVLIAKFSPEVLAVAAPALIKASLFCSVAAGIALLAYVPYLIINDIREKTDEIHHLMGFNLRAANFQQTLDTARENPEYYLNFTRIYATGLWNRFNTWRVNHPAQFAGVTAGVVVFVLLTVFTGAFLGHASGFEFMQPAMNFLTDIITPVLGGIKSFASIAAPMAQAMAATFLILAPLAFAHVARGFGQTAHEAQYAAYGLDKNSEHIQDQGRSMSPITMKQFRDVNNELQSVVANVDKMRRHPLFALQPPKSGKNNSQGISSDGDSGAYGKTQAPSVSSSNSTSD